MATQTEQQKQMQNWDIYQFVQAIERKQKDGELKIHYTARPYLDAMSVMNKITDSYGAESGKSIVLYFLSNAHTMKGEFMRDVKAELNRRVKS